MQDKAKLGTRYTCFKCGCKFYDLNKPEALCPKCGVDQADDPTPDPRVAVMSRYKGSRTPPRTVATHDAPSATEANLDDATEDQPTDDQTEDADEKSSEA